MNTPRKKQELKQLGNGYVEGPDAYLITRVSKARKRYDCYGPLRAVRDTDAVSPGTGDALRCLPADGCTTFIEPGELYAHVMPHDVEVYESYWTAHRMCLKCAIKEDTVRKSS
jgi:hypothetical protein